MGYFLMVVAATIASVAAYFSVYGLAHIFAATFWSVVIMGAILEIGKLAATSFLYRYWEHIKISLRIYLLTAIFGLMVLTSAGIFGYLSSAYQQDIIGVKDVAARIELLQTELTSLTAREQQINEDIGRIGSNYVSARQNMIKQYGPEKDKIVTRIAEIRSETLALASKQLEVEAHTGPIIYIAKAMDRDVDDAVLWMIGLIIFVFDPLAVALTIGANIALTTRFPNNSQLQVESSGPNYLNEYNIALSQLEDAVNSTLAIEGEMSHKQDMIETLSEDNQRLEDELFALAAAFERKDATISQLRDVVRLLEQEQPKPLTIEERAALHTRNQVQSKQL